MSSDTTFISLSLSLPSFPVSLCLSLKSEKQSFFFFQWEVGLLTGDSGFELFTVNHPWVRFLGARVVSVQVPRPLRINEVSNGDKDNRGHGEKSEAAMGTQVRMQRAWGLEHIRPCYGS